MYGTLKRGMRAHRYLLGSRFVGVGRTGPEWTLLSNGIYPALVKAPEGMDADLCGVLGEVFEIPGESVWEALDQYEGVEGGLYLRGEITLEHLEWDAGWEETHDSGIGKFRRVQTYIFSGDTAGFDFYGNCW